MATSIGTIFGTVELRDAFSDVFNDFQTNVKSTQQILSSVGPALTAALTLPILAIGGASVKMAADAEESENLFSETFKEMSDSVRDWSETTSDALGLNAFALRESAGSFFLLANNMGQTREAAGGMAQQLVELSGDLASFLNLDPTEVSAAMQSGLVGNTEALRMLNVFVNEATLRQVAFEEGISETNRQLSQTEKFQATYAAILQQTTVAQGDLLRTQESFQNQLRRMTSELSEVAIELGNELVPILKDHVLPLLTGLIEVVKQVVSSFSQMPSVVKTTIVAFAGLLALAGPAAFLAAQILNIGAAFAGASAGVATFGAAVTASLGPAIAIIGTFIAAFTLTQVIAELTGIQEFLDKTIEKYGQFTDEGEPTIQQITAMSKASVIAGRDINTWAEATEILNKELAIMRGEVAEVEEETKVFNQTLEEEVKAAIKAREEAKTLSAAKKILGRDAIDLAEAERVLIIAEKEAADGTKEFEDRMRDLDDAINKNIADMKRFQEEAERVAAAAEEEIKIAADERIKARFPRPTEPVIIPAEIEIRNAMVEDLPALGDFARGMTDVADKNKELVESQELFNKQMAVANDLAQLIGGTFGKIVGQITGIGASLKALSVAGGGGGFGGVVKGIKSTFSEGMKEAGGSGIMGLIGGMTAVIPMIGPMLGPAIAGVKALIGKLFGGADLGETIGREMGVSISESLQSTIEESGRHQQLFVADIFREAIAGGDTGATDKLAEEIGDIFSGITQGLFTEGEGIAAIQEAIPLLIENFGELGEAGEEQVGRIIAAAQEMGLEIEGINDLIVAQMGPSLESVAEKFGLSVQEARTLSEILGKELPTEMQILAAQIGTTPALLKEVGAAMEEQLGIPAEQISELMETMGISFEELAKSLNVELPEGMGKGEEGAEGLAENTAAANENLAGAVGEAKELADWLGRAATNSGNISIPSGNTDLPQFAEGGVFNGPTVGILGEAGPEVAAPVSALFGRLGSNIAKQVAGAVGGGGGGGVNNITISPSMTIAEPLATAEAIQNAILPPLVDAIKKDLNSITGEITRKQERS